MNSKFTSLVRWLLGILLIVFGSNKFIHFIPDSLGAGTPSQYLDSFSPASYLFPIVGILELLIGVMLLMKKWDAFALILLTPITINILLFHVFLNVPGIGIASLVAVLNGILLYKHRRLYNPLFIK